MKKRGNGRGPENKNPSKGKGWEEKRPTEDKAPLWEGKFNSTETSDYLYQEFGRRSKKNRRY